MPTNSAPTPPALAQRCSVLHAPESTARRGATVATESRKATTTLSAVARTNSPLRVASMPAGGMVEKTRPPAAGQGIDASRARGAPDTSGAVTSVTNPSDPVPCGHRMVAVLWLTGSSGVRPHSSSPTTPATIAISRLVRAGTRDKGMRRRCDPCGATRRRCLTGSQRCGAPQSAAGGGAEVEPRGLRVRVPARQALQRAPVAEPVVLEVGRHRGRAHEEFGDAERSPTQVVYHRRVGLRAEAVGQDPPLGHLGDAVLVAERTLAWERQADQPVEEHGVGRPDDLLQRAQHGDARRGDGDPMLRG